MSIINNMQWIPLSDRKNISQVKVRFEERNNQPYGGYYIVETKEIVVVHGDYEHSTIAHEFRHHIQNELSIYTSVRKGSVFDTKKPHEESIKHYFRKYSHEMDALLYEHKVAKTDVNDWWLRKLVL